MNELANAENPKTTIPNSRSKWKRCIKSIVSQWRLKVHYQLKTVRKIITTNKCTTKIKIKCANNLNIIKMLPSNIIIVIIIIIIVSSIVSDTKIKCKY